MILYECVYVIGVYVNNVFIICRLCKYGEVCGFIVLVNSILINAR